jgi:hypothetical protein
MVKSTNLNRTAAEVISIELLEKFGEEVKQDRVNCNNNCIRAKMKNIIFYQCGLATRQKGK